MSPDDTNTTAARSWKSRIVLMVKVAIFALVVWGLWRSLDNAYQELQQQQLSWRQIDGRWLVASAAIYLAGSLPMGIFWFAILRSFRQHPRPLETLRAFYIGHLGKYVPGKAMVVILRAGLIRSERVDTSVATVSVFVETLTMMAVGGFLAAIALAVWFREQPLLLLLAIGLVMGMGLPTVPPLFRTAVRMLGVRKASPAVEEALQGLSWRLMALGWAANVVGWSLIVGSYWAVLWALPMPTAEAEAVRQTPALVIPVMTASVCLAMTAGFVSLLPGGLGIREFIVLTLVQPVFGPVVAVASAVLLRVAWMGGEAAAAAAFYVYPGGGRQSDYGIQNEYGISRSGAHHTHATSDDD